METTAETSVLKKFNLSKLPEAGSEHVGKFFNTLWEDARKEKIGRLGLHQRFLDLHAAYRGKKKKAKYPRVGANFLFKIIESYCATLTEKVPIADLTADDTDDPIMVKAMAKESDEWWNESEQQVTLHASTLNLEIYGTTIEKGIFNVKTGEPEIVLRDAFNFFPAPGYKMCDLNIPYVCDVDFLDEWEIRAYGVPEGITIPADADEQLAGTIREVTRGGSESSPTSRHYPTNYAPVQESTVSESLKNKTLVVEIWIRDNTTIKEPIMQSVQPTDDLGRPAGGPIEQDTGEVNEYPVYPDGIRKVLLCPALLDNHQVKGILDDSVNPNINWGLLQARIEALVQEGIPEPILDEAGAPMVDETGQPAVQMIPVPPEEAKQMVFERAKTSFPLWGKFSYSAIPSRIDSSQWWGFSIIEQLEEQQGKAEQMLTKYFAALERQMFPIFKNVQGSGVNDSEITNDPGIVIHPTIAAAQHMGYIDSPPPPREYLDAIDFIMRMMDIIAMSPEVSEGRRPKGISAASAIIALQDKASTLFSPQIRQIDKLIRNRGRMWLHFKMNFDTVPKQVKVDGQVIDFRGADVFSNFKFNVESGSSAPITKAGRRQQMVELRKMGDMDRLSMLEQLDIPQAKLIHERLTEEQSVPGALKILVEAGLPIPTAQQLYGFLMQDQFSPKPNGGTTMKTAEQSAPTAGGYSESMNSARQGMSELQEG